MNFHLDFSGLFSALVGIVLGGTGFIIATVGLIVALVEKKRNNRTVFQQRAGSFFAGGLVQLGLSVFFFVPLLDHKSSGRTFREMMDVVAACSFLLIIGVAITIIIIMFRRVSAKYYSVS